MTTPEPIRTDFHCTNCSKTFVVLLDLRLDGYHRVRCPYCDHIHYRKVVAGSVTEDRAPGREDTLPIIDVGRNSVWTTQRLATYNSTTAEFIRQRWLNRHSEGHGE